MNKKQQTSEVLHQEENINLNAKPSTLEPNTITFATKSYPNFIKLEDNGNIYVKGTLVENDKELVNALREYLLIVAPDLFK